jgi:hypothetical protein
VPSLFPSEGPVRFLLKGARTNEKAAAKPRYELLNALRLFETLLSIVNDDQIVITICCFRQQSIEQIPFFVYANNK